jgi:hypothetical protein
MNQVALTYTWESLSHSCSRNDRPVILFANRFKLSRTELVKGIASAWTGCEFPLRTYAARTWKSLFNQALATGEYIDEETLALSSALPETLQLYRGARSTERNGMSWTDSLDRARWFADRNVLLGFDGRVYTASVDRSVVLAKFHAQRGEGEYVIDASKLVTL